MPINPGKGSSITDTGLGTIGLAVTGGVFFNDLSNPDGSLAMANEGTSLDSCLGHSAPTGSNGGGGGRPPPGGAACLTYDIWINIFQEGKRDSLTSQVSITTMGTSTAPMLELPPEQTILTPAS